MTIYELTGSVRQLQDMSCDTPEDWEAFDALMQEIGGRIEDKAEAYCKVLANIDSDINGHQSELDRIYKKQKALQAKRDRIKERLQAELETVWHEGETHKCGTFSLRIQRTAPRVELVGPVPCEYIRVKEEVDKAAIMADLKDGKYLAFAELTRGKTLAIR